MTPTIQGARPQAARRSSLAAKESRYFWLCISPWIVGFVLFQGGPIVASLLLSLTEWNLLRDPEWVGFGNFVKLFTRDEVFMTSLVNTAYYTVGHIVPTVVLALGAALLLNRGIRGLPLYRTIYYVPTIVPIVATAVLWKWIFNPNFGLLNAGLELVGIPKIPWLGSLEWAMPAIIIMSWWSFGVGMVVLLAGLQGVPEHLLEAARIDGANAWHEFWHVVVPMISPVLFFVIIVQVIGSFQIFTPTYIMTEGGPGNATLTIVLYLYRNGFQYFQMGYASAIAWVLVVVVLAATLLQFRIGKAWVYYEGDTKPTADKP
ncbi:MAG TPA: sugar ABC transporter permease [Chloroflexota bacterium]|nr:sugar ABC transporter permease [Chloroflexota bacterium]